MHMISADEVHRLLDYRSLVDALRKAHCNPDFAAGEVMLPEPGEAATDRAFLALPAWRKNSLIGVKLVTVFPGNPAEQSRLPANQGVYVGFDASNGAPVLVADGTALTLRKTAADTALGVDLLASAAAEDLLLIGAGALAPHLIEAVLAVRPSVRRIRIWNRNAAKAAALAAETRHDGVRVEAVEDLIEPQRAADIIVSATMSTAPLVQGRLLKPGCHVNLVGSWRPDMLECDEETIRRAHIYTDSHSDCRQCGEFVQAVASGAMTWSDIRADLFALCAGQVEARCPDGGITLFKNAGGGQLDLFAAEELLARLRAKS